MKKLLRMTPNSTLAAIVSSMERIVFHAHDSATWFEVGEGRQVALVVIETLGRRQQVGTNFCMPITGTIHSSPWGTKHNEKQFKGLLNLDDETISIEFDE